MELCVAVAAGLGLADAFAECPKPEGPTASRKKKGGLPATAPAASIASKVHRYWYTCIMLECIMYHVYIMYVLCKVDVSDHGKRASPPHQVNSDPDPSSH